MTGHLRRITGVAQAEDVAWWEWFLIVPLVAAQHVLARVHRG